MGAVRKQKAAEKPPSYADSVEETALDHAVELMIREVLSHLDHTRPIGSMDRRTLRRIAISAISGWIVKRSELTTCSIEDVAQDLISGALFAVPN